MDSARLSAIAAAPRKMVEPRAHGAIHETEAQTKTSSRERRHGDGGEGDGEQGRACSLGWGGHGRPEPSDGGYLREDSVPNMAGLGAVV